MFATAPKEVRDWLSEYKILKEAELYTYSHTIRNANALIDQLVTLLEEGLGGQWLEPVCHQLYNFFKSGHVELRRFTLDLVPTLVWVYLSAVSRGEKRKCSGLEACLLGIYNLEIVDADGKPKVNKYTIPTLAVPSIYHEPPSLATLAFTESSLYRYHSEQPIHITTAAKEPCQSITAQNRLMLVTYVLSVYNDEIGHMSTRSHIYYCKLSSKLAQAGFAHMEDVQTGLIAVNLNDSFGSTSSRDSKRSVLHIPKTQPRVQLSSEVLVTLLTGVYYIIFNGQAMRGVEALERVHRRASYELYAEVLLVTNAIRNSLQANPSGQPEDGPMGISVALSPAQRDSTLSKHAITNASFRAKRLPEDIDIVNDEEGDGPPQYSDVIDTDRSDKSQVSTPAPSEKSSKSKNPLKSIMKKTSIKDDKKPAISQSQRHTKSAPTAEILAATAPLSPKHSNSAYSDIADPNHVQVALGSRANSVSGDKVEMSSLPSQQSLPVPISGNGVSRSIQKRSPSHDETSGVSGKYLEVVPNGVNGTEMPPAYYSEETNTIVDKLKQNSLDIDQKSHSSNGSLNTAL